tara:strand:- start:12710 stop:13024 length:315 start_codon:yes stop_codon:yes gene_type:complete
MEDQIILNEFLEQVNYCLSLKFKERWRFRFSSHFISIFQEKVLNSLNTQRPLKLSSLTSVYIKKHKYSASEVKEFFRVIAIEDYYPLVYEDKKFIEQKSTLFTE